MKRNRIQKKPPTKPVSNLILEEIIGLTTKHSNGLSSNTSTSKCAYIAGCVVVIYDVDAGNQSHFMVSNRMPRPLSCVSLSKDASIVAAGESGHQPAILVWDCNTFALICELKGHQYGVRCVSLPPDGKHLVSAGFPRDGCICLWDWRNKTLVTKIKASSPSSPVASIHFSSQEQLFVTAGKNHFKFWKIKQPTGSRLSNRSVSVTTESVVNLDHQKEWSFVAVTSFVNDIQGSELVTFYAVTEKGTLCMVQSGSSVVNSVKLEVDKCFAVSASNSLVACACDNGIVELFDTGSLKYTGRLCYDDMRRKKASNVAGSWPRIPDAIACQFSTLKKLVVVYDDYSLYVWNIDDILMASKCCVLVTHSGCIWDIRNVPCEYKHDPSLSCVARGCSGGLCFATCSVDGTIRLWDLAVQSTLLTDNLSLAVDEITNGNMCLVSAGIFELDPIAIDTRSSHGFRSMAVSSDGKHLAAADSCGSIHIFDLYTSENTYIQDAHGGEILSLSFNSPNKNDTASTEVIESKRLLASGGHDGIIHLFDIDRKFNLIGSIKYHSSAVTVVKVGQSGRDILSCSDRFLVLHSIDLTDKECKISTLKQIATHGPIIDMVVDHSLKIALTISQDKQIDMFDIRCGKLINRFKHDGDAGDPMKITTDGSCSYAACSYSNKCVCVYDYTSGEMVAKAIGHSDVITGVTFLPDCKHLVSVGDDGCIFVWKLPAPLSSKMLQRVEKVPICIISESSNDQLTTKQLKPYEVDCPREVSVKGNWKLNCDKMLFSESNCEDDSGYRFSISQLPNWAQHKFDNNSLPVDADSSSSKVDSNHNACLKPQSPSKTSLEVVKQNSGKSSRLLSETDSSQGSQTPTEYYSWTNHQWLTIHTVCMDISNSPKTCEMKGLNVQGSSMDKKPHTAHSEVNETVYSSKRIKLSSLDPTSSNPSAESDFKIDAYDKYGDNPFSQCEDVDSFSKDSQEDGSFGSNLGDLSEQVKTDKEKSFTMSSSRFRVRREVLDGRKMSFGFHAPDFAIASSTRDNEGAGNASPMSSTQINDRTTGAETLKTNKAINSGELKARDVSEVDEEAETVKLCKEALCNLEDAAESALQSFSKLTILSNREENPRGSKLQLYDVAAEKFPLIETKFHAIAKLLKTRASNVE